jgi:hypothetical protein
VEKPSGHQLIKMLMMRDSADEELVCLCVVVLFHTAGSVANVSSQVPW